MYERGDKLGHTTRIILHFVVCGVFSNLRFKNSFRNAMRASNSWDPDQALRFCRV